MAGDNRSMALRVTGAVALIVAGLIPPGGAKGSEPRLTYIVPAAAESDDGEPERFKIPDLIEFISTVVTLEPGDVVLTGTPSGVGFSYRPPRWLKPGEEVVIKVSGIGELRNPMIAEA